MTSVTVPTPSLFERIEAAHARRHWRVDALAADFERLDSWPLRLAHPPKNANEFDDFCRIFAKGGGPASLAGRALWQLRLALGWLFRWDAHNFSLPIPGCSEHAVAERLDAATCAASRSPVGAPPPGAPMPDFLVVYHLDDELLLEISNSTVHALLHLGCLPGEQFGDADLILPAVGGADVVLNVYIKSRGWTTRAYMALIMPFRHLVIYPGWLARLRRAWAHFRSDEPTRETRGRDQAAPHG